MIEDKVAVSDNITSFLIECLVWNIPNNMVLYENLWVSKIQLAAQEVYHIDEVIDISESSGSFFG
jgi:hypothetical protein